MQIEQIDRDAAAEEVYEREKGNLAWPYARSTCDRILSGDWDHHPTVQRYARHRLAALSARPAVGEDVVERVQDMLVAAYEAGATAVHNSWVEGTNGGEPDFYEAASDYARAAVAARPADSDMVERVAFALWKGEADRAAPNVAKNRTLEAFADESADTRNKWHLMARAAIAATNGEQNERN